METVTLELPASLYADLQALAAKEDGDLVALLSRWVVQRQEHQRELRELQSSIQRESGLDIGNTREEVIKQMRETRQEIFEAEYARLHR